MKKKSVSKAAFFNPRALIGFGFGAIGFFLAVVAFITFPSTSALAVPGTCATVTFEDVPGEDYNELYVTMTSDAGCTIYYTVSATTWPSDPTHNSAIYSSQLGVPYLQRRYYKALAYKAHAYPTEDSAITSHFVYNDNE